MRPEDFASMLLSYDSVRTALKRSLSEVSISDHRIGAARKPEGLVKGSTRTARICDLSRELAARRR
jgi:hypothetical protein